MYCLFFLEFYEPNMLCFAANGTTPGPSEYEVLYNGKYTRDLLPEGSYLSQIIQSFQPDFAMMFSHTRPYKMPSACQIHSLSEATVIWVIITLNVSHLN